MGRAVEIGNPPIAVEIRRSARARRLSLRVSRLDGKATLTMPRFAPEREAMSFLHAREDWLRGHVGGIADRVQVGPGVILPFRGGTLEVAEGSTRRARLLDGRLEVPSHGAGPRAKAALIVEARAALAEASDRYAARLGRSYAALALRDTRSRWGSCSSAGRLMYSWRLIMAPPDVLDYVAAHEVAHLAEMNHSPAFWTVVETLCPDHKRLRRWLRTEGSSLHRYDFGD